MGKGGKQMPQFMVKANDMVCGTMNKLIGTESYLMCAKQRAKAKKDQPLLVEALPKDVKSSRCC